MALAHDHTAILALDLEVALGMEPVDVQRRILQVVVGVHERIDELLAADLLSCQDSQQLVYQL